MKNYNKIIDKKEQLLFLQKLHWANNDVNFHFSTESTTDKGSEKFVSLITDNFTNKEHRSMYGLYDDAIIIVLDEKEYILNEMSIKYEGYLEGKTTFTRRDDLFNELYLLGIQKL